MPTSAEQTQQLYQLAESGQSRTSSPQSAEGQGNVVIGDTSARTTMGGSGGGGSGSSGGGAGYSLGASIAQGPTTTTSGAYGDDNSRAEFGDHNFNFGGGSIATTGSSRALMVALIAAGAAAIAFLAWRR